MAITNRIRRLFFADFHALLDVVEEPEAVLKQAIREMQDDLDHKQARLARSEHTLDSLRKNEKAVLQTVEKTDRDIRLCVQKDSDDLARKAIARKIALQKHLATLDDRITRLAQSCQEQRDGLAIQHKQLEAIYEKARLFVPSVPGSDSPLAVAEAILACDRPGARTATSAMPMSATDEEVELEWIRLKESGQKGGKA